MRIYVDGRSVFTVSSSRLDTYIAMPSGSHYVVVQAWDSNGAVFKAPMTVNVSGTASTGGGVTVTSPANGATVSPSVHFIASASSSYPITAMKLYVDGTERAAVSGGSLDKWLTLAAGTRAVTVQAWNTQGTVYRRSLTVNVSTTSGSTGGSSAVAIPSYAKAFRDIEEMPGWKHCTVCAGINASGPVALYGMTQYVSSPSMDGRSAKFWIGGSTPYSNALWWKQLGADATKKKFVYELYFYLKQPQYAQALEFDVNQSVNGKKHIFGTQCTYKNGLQWDVWDGLGKRWVHTGVTCNVPAPYTWHHLVEEFARDDHGNVYYVSITLNGKKHYINRKYGSINNGTVQELNVAFQMDGDYAMHDYEAWLDNVTLFAW